jgi:hypothetical protein
VTSWCHNLMTRLSSLGSSMTLGVWIFMVSLKRDVYRFKIFSKVAQGLIKFIWITIVNSQNGCNQNCG